jgi:uncharacterized protein YaaR (DUF327 family)
MNILLIFLLVIAGIIIYKLNDNADDDKIIKSNYMWKEKISKLKSLIEQIESKENELSQKGTIIDINSNKEDIKNYKEEIIRLQENIYRNEQYLKEKGKT